MTDKLFRPITWKTATLQPKWEKTIKLHFHERCEELCLAGTKWEWFAESLIHFMILPAFLKVPSWLFIYFDCNYSAACSVVMYVWSMVLPVYSLEPWGCNQHSQKQLVQELILRSGLCWPPYLLYYVTAVIMGWKVYLESRRKLRVERCGIWWLV